MKLLLCIVVLMAALLVTEGKLFGRTKINFCRRNSQKSCRKFAKEDCDTRSLFGRGKVSKKSRSKCVRMARRFCERPVLPKSASSCKKLARRRCGRGKVAQLCRSRHESQCRQMAKCNKKIFVVREAKRKLRLQAVHTVVARPFRKRSVKSVKSKCKACKGLAVKRCLTLARVACGPSKRRRRCRRVFYSSCRRPVLKKSCSKDAIKKCGTSAKRNVCRKVHRRHCRKINSNCRTPVKTKADCKGNSHGMCFAFAKNACGAGRANLRCRRVFYGHCRKPIRVSTNKCAAQSKRLCGPDKKQWKCRHIHLKHCKKVARECKCKVLKKTNCQGKTSRVCTRLSLAACGSGRKYRKCRSVFRRNCRRPHRTSESCSGQARRLCGDHASHSRCRSVHRKHCRAIQKQCKCRKKSCVGLPAKKCAVLSGKVCGSGKGGKRCRRVFRRHCRKPVPVKDCVGQSYMECGGCKRCRRVHLEHCRKIRRNCKCKVTKKEKKTLPPQPKCPRKCKRHRDCVSSDQCHVGHCATDGVCRYRDTCGATRCNAAKCNDNNPCTLDRCTKNGCEHTDICNGHKCPNGKVCNDKDMLTQDLCGKNNKCHHVPVCKGKNDADQCWTYKAEVTGFWFEEKTGVSNPIAKCVRGRPKPSAKHHSQCHRQGISCYIDNDCQAPTSSGLIGHCSNFKCTFYNKCKSNSDCGAVKGDSPCITSKCHKKYGVCSWKAKCEDSNPCTLDRCTVTGKNSHRCDHEQVKCSVGECPSLTRTIKETIAIEEAKCDPTKGCGVCVLDSACDDGIACTLDKCVGFKCVHTPISGKNIDPWLNLWCDPNVNGFKVRDQTDPRVVAASRAPTENI